MREDLNCNEVRLVKGMAYPRTCAKCGLGPCHYALNSKPEPESFAAYPESVTEKKADKVGIDNAHIWTARDLLISMLRDIDSGKLIPTTLVVVFEVENKEDKTKEAIGFKQFSQSLYRSIGIMEAAKALMLEK